MPFLTFGINIDDVIDVLNSCKTQLIVIGVALVVAIAIVVAVMKLPRS